ncbi:MAG: ParA family protein [Defluviitaleaceae bacterium]|nr:ParA family protein [Defluviitaleaceae bacterium]
MRVICVINLKGGVAKTISSINIAHILAEKHGERVLLIDCDKQGNTSKFFGVHSYKHISLADVLLARQNDALVGVARVTKYKNLDIVPANMHLMRAEREILLDISRPQQTRLKKSLQEYRKHKEYDYVVVDCAPDLNMSVVNAIVAADDIIIPIKVDKFAFDGIDQLLEQIEELREFNPNLRIVGGFITMYSRTNVNMQGVEVLKEKANLPMFSTVIRNTAKVVETTYEGLPIVEHTPKSSAAKDYLALVVEYLELVNVSETITNEGSEYNVY